jgi:hypothetical protein
LAFKFLDAGRGPFSGFAWPVPAGPEPGPWVEAGSGPLCVGGVHACSTEHLAYWAASELWLVELDGDVVRHPIKIAAPRGRLLRRVSRYDEGGRTEWLRDVRLRARYVAAEQLRAAGEPGLAHELDSAPPSEWSKIAARERRAGAIGLLLGYLADAATFTDAQFRVATFCAAHTALTVPGYQAERLWQSNRLAELMDAPSLLG